jgi:hypothetical protein
MSLSAVETKAASPLSNPRPHSVIHAFMRPYDIKVVLSIGPELQICIILSLIASGR